MTITTTEVVAGPYAPNGVTKTFPFNTIQVQSANHILVEITGVVVDASLYNVLLNDDGTGSVVFFTAPTGTSLYIKTNPDFRQQVELNNQGPYFQEELEEALDLAATRDQYLKAQLDRSLKFPVGSTPFEIDTTGLTEGDLFEFRSGKMRRFNSGPFAGKFYAGEAGSGRPTPASGMGEDGDLRGDLAEPEGAANVGHRDTGANAQTVSQRAFNLFQPIRPGMFTSLAAALAEASATGRTLIIDEGHELTSGLTTTLTGPLNIELTHRALFENTSLTPVYMLMRFILAGHSLRMEGADWEVALNDMAAFGLRIEHDSEIGRPDVFIGGARVYDSFVGPGFLGGNSSNINIVGNLNMVELQDVRAFGCRRSSNTAGAFNHAMNGVTQNIVIARTSFTKGPLHVRLRNVEAHDALTPDPQYANADNYALFQNFEAGATFLADDIRSYNGQGRGIKIQCGSAQAVVRNAYLFRNVQCITTNTGTGDLSAQYERGLFENIVIEYEGANVHNASLANSRTGTTAVLTYHTPGSNSNGELDYGLGPCEIRNVDIRDRSTGGHPITIGNFGFSDDANHPPRQIVVDNVKVTGGLVKHGFELNSVGLFKSVNATFNAIQARFDTRANGASFFLGNLDNKNMLATFTNCENFGTDELRMGKLYGGGYTDISYGCFIDGGGNRGFYNSSGVVSGEPGLIDVPLTNFATALRPSYSPITKVDAREIAMGSPDVEPAPPPVAFNPLGDGYAHVGFKPRLAGGGPAIPGEYRVAGNSNAITVVQASTQITVGSSGVEPAPVGPGAQILLWWVAADKRFYAKAHGDAFFLSQIPLMAG